MSALTLPGAVVITGAGAGIGRATALSCAELGASVAALDIDSANATASADAARAAGAPASIGIGCDVRDEASVQRAIEQAATALGPIQGLVTSAGIDRAGFVHEMTLEHWRQVIDINLTGTFLTCKHTLAHMLKHARGGSIVCVSSAWAGVSAPGGASAYCASKGGVSSLVRSVALDYAAHGIRVNGVIPGATETGLMWANTPADEIPTLRSRIGSQIAMGRLGQPEDIAAGIVWLLSTASAYATGSHLAVDGGLLAKGSVEA